MERETDKSILDCKLEDVAYSSYDDFKAPGELMVTITLHEYRDLIEKRVTSETAIDKFVVKVMDLKEEKKKLMEKLDSLNKEKVLFKGQLQATVEDERRIKCKALDEIFDQVNAEMNSYLADHHDELQKGDIFCEGVSAAFTEFVRKLREIREVFENE